MSIERVIGLAVGILLVLILLFVMLRVAGMA